MSRSFQSRSSNLICSREIIRNWGFSSVFLTFFHFLIISNLRKALERPTPASSWKNSESLLEPCGVENLRHENTIKYSLGGTFRIKIEPKHMKVYFVCFFILISMEQIIYILTNEAMPGYVKIGKTTTSLEQRIKELSSSTSIPLPFTCFYACTVRNCDFVERQLHEAF